VRTLIPLLAAALKIKNAAFIRYPFIMHFKQLHLLTDNYAN